LPDALACLIKKGICGISCGESFNATLESAAKEREFSDTEINNILIDLNKFIINSNTQIHYVENTKL
jgi:hypothetical protein